MSKNVSDNIKKIVDELSSCTVVEILELVKVLEEQWGVSAAPVAAAVAAPTAVQEAPSEEKSEFNVVLVAVPEKKIEVIKVLRTITNLPIKDAKEIVDNPPKTIKESVSKAEAEDIKAQLEKIGAKVELN